MFRKVILLIAQTVLLSAHPHLITNTGKELILSSGSVVAKDIRFTDKGEYILNDGCVINSNKLGSSALVCSHKRIGLSLQSEKLWWRGKALNLPFRVYKLESTILFNGTVVSVVSTDLGSVKSPSGEDAFTYECIVWVSKSGRQSGYLEMGPINLLNLYKIDCQKAR